MKKILYLTVAIGIIFLTINERGPIYRMYEDLVLSSDDAGNDELRLELQEMEILAKTLLEKVKKENNCALHDKAVSRFSEWLTKLENLENSDISPQNKITNERFNKYKPELEFTAGLCYSNKSEYQNISKANEYFLNAALAGQPRAQVALGLNYRLGRGFEKDDNLALHWFTMAAESDNDRGLYWTGMHHKEGRGIAPNPDLARQYFMRSYEITKNEELKALLDSLLNDSSTALPTDGKRTD